jgi:NADH:ubiquinone oxidoreductase subunit 6 (subunit J)
MVKQTVDSKWWYGNAVTLGLFLLFLIAAGINILVGGTAWSARLSVIFVTASLGVGYLSIISFYFDTRKVRSETEYSPKVWLYMLGYIIASPVLVSAVYLINRSEHVVTSFRD